MDQDLAFIVEGAWIRIQRSSSRVHGSGCGIFRQERAHKGACFFGWTFGFIHRDIVFRGWGLQGYLAHAKQHPPRTLQ